MSPLPQFHCQLCGTVIVRYMRDLQHAQCPGCRAIYKVIVQLVDPGQSAAVGRLVQPSRRVRVGG